MTRTDRFRVAGKPEAIWLKLALMAMPRFHGAKPVTTRADSREIFHTASKLTRAQKKASRFRGRHPRRATYFC
jgi:hypothetical protein